MLRQRIITASILAPLIVLAVFFLPVEYFTLLWGSIILIGAWEWSDLAGVKKLFPRILFLALLAFSMAFFYYWTVFLELLSQIFDNPEIKRETGIIEWTVVPVVIWWLLVMVLIRNAGHGMLQLEIKKRYKLLAGWFILLSAWMFLSRLRSFYGAEITMYFLLLIWAADISAYFTGKKFGKTKLAPEISPGKTVEGFYGAMGAAFLSALCLGLYLRLMYGQVALLTVLNFTVLSLFTVMVSIYGDLFISLVKRKRGVKDSGLLLPGHGGLLDRVDSIIAAIPLFYGGVILIYLTVQPSQ